MLVSYEGESSWTSRRERAAASRNYRLGKICSGGACVSSRQALRDRRVTAHLISIVLFSTTFAVFGALCTLKLDPPELRCAFGGGCKSFCFSDNMRSLQNFAGNFMIWAFLDFAKLKFAFSSSRLFIDAASLVARLTYTNCSRLQHNDVIPIVNLRGDAFVENTGDIFFQTGE